MSTFYPDLLPLNRTVLRLHQLDVDFTKKGRG